MAIFNKNTHQYLNDNKTLYEVVMLSDQYGNAIGPANPTGMAVDAFGRARVSTPLTMFDSSHRYADNGLWSNAITGTASTQFNQSQGLILLNVDDQSGTQIIRETYKVFSYQPGKSLQVLQTFVFASPKANLRQRVGYFGAQNGIYLEQDGTNISFVERTYVTGAVNETRVSQANWNIDRLDGTGPSLLTLDLTKAQIMHMDIEWLGLGTVRLGFVINGMFIHCHSFHHANLITSTYITTASLPLRQEIANTGATASASTAKQVCASVISEGGYELRGRQQTIGTSITAPKALDTVTAGVPNPVVSLRLKADRLDAVVILTAMSFMPSTAGSNFRWDIRAGGTITDGVGGVWTSAGADSSVEYKLDGTGITGTYRTLACGYSTAANQSTSTINILKEALFKFQLERDASTNTPEILTLVVSSSVKGDAVHGSLDWEEVTR